MIGMEGKEDIDKHDKVQLVDENISDNDELTNKKGFCSIPVTLLLGKRTSNGKSSVSNRILRIEPYEFIKDECFDVGICHGSFIYILTGFCSIPDTLLLGKRTSNDECFDVGICHGSFKCTLTDRLFCSNCHQRVNFKTMKDEFFDVLDGSPSLNLTENESKEKTSYSDSGRSFLSSHWHYRPWSRLEEETKERRMEQPKKFWQLTKRLESLRSLNLCSADIEPKKNKGQNIYEMKKCLSDLTCLLTDDVPDGGILNYRSGRVADVIQYKEKDMKKCACAACSLSECPKDKWWNVRVHTCSSRNHDPGNVKLTLFYDHVDSHVTTLQNGSTLFENRKRDISWIDFPTCDQELATLLGKMVDSFNALSGELTMKYRDRRDGNNLVIIVSHPFGLPKFVSIGRLIEESYGQEKNPKRYEYTNPTFPGTDGAHVFVLGK